MGWVHIADRQGISHKNTWKQTSKRKVNVYRFDKMDFLTEIECSILEKEYSSIKSNIYELYIIKRFKQ
jgi:hypothetical protein